MKKEKLNAEQVREQRKANSIFDELVRSAEKKGALISVEEITDGLPLDRKFIGMEPDAEYTQAAGEEIEAAAPDLVFAPVPKPLADYKTAQIPLFK